MSHAISSYFVDTCIIGVVSKDEFGEATYTDVTVPCYIKWKPKSISDISGTDVLAAGTIYMEERALSFDDRITIGGKKYKIININHAMAFNLQHLEVVIQ